MKPRALLALLCIIGSGLVGGQSSADEKPPVVEGVTCRWLKNKTQSCTAPTATVVLNGGAVASPEQAAVLQGELALPVSPSDFDGALRYFDEEKFARVPTIIKTPPMVDPLRPDEGGEPTQIEVIDPRALLDLPVLPGPAALDKARNALAAAGLLPAGAEGVTSNTTFELAPNPDALLPSAHDVLAELFGRKIALDTRVSFQAKVGGLPVHGPGAKIGVAFDGEGNTTGLLYTMRPLVSGPSVPVVAPSLMPGACASALQGSADDLADVQVSRSEFVLYAPPIGLSSVQRLYPHLVCGGTATTAGGEIIDLREMVVPATSAAPQVSLQAGADGAEIFASSYVMGGTPPYTYSWSSSATGAMLPDEAAISYALDARDEITSETVSVTVTDANGLTATAGVEIALDDVIIDEPTNATDDVDAGLSIGTPAGGQIPRLDVGMEWVDARSQANVDNWTRATNNASIPIQFRWGRTAAWEREFKVPTGGTYSYVDDVDMTVYTGHANGDGWTFESFRDDQFLDYRDGVSFGASDLEWLVIAACGPLQPGSGSSHWSKWGRVFDGLHEMFGYATVSEFNSIELQYFMEYITNRRRPPGTSGASKVEMAWVWAAWESQPSSVTYAAMGPYGPGGQANFNDYFWGYGAVTNDIPAEDITGFYYISGQA